MPSVFEQTPSIPQICLCCTRSLAASIGCRRLIATRWNTDSPLVGPSIAITASVSAPLLYRASPFNPILRPPSTHQSPDSIAFTTATSKETGGPLPPYGPDVLKRPPDSTQQEHQTSLNSTASPHPPSIPALSTLASVAPAPSPHLRYGKILPITLPRVAGNWTLVTCGLRQVETDA